MQLHWANFFTGVMMAQYVLPVIILPHLRRNVPQFLIAIHKYFEAFEEEEKRNFQQIGGEK